MYFAVLWSPLMYVKLFWIISNIEQTQSSGPTFQDSKDRSADHHQCLEDKDLYSAENVGAKESSKLKFHRNPLKTVSNAARTIRKSPKNHKKNSKTKGRVALMKVKSIFFLFSKENVYISDDF